MKPRVIRSDRAEEDLVQILAYLRERSSRAADQFERTFLEQIETLARFPIDRPIAR